MADLYRYGSTKEVYFVITDTSNNGVTGNTFSAGDVQVSKDGGAWADISSECSEVTDGKGWYKWTPSASSQTQAENLLFVFDDGTNAENRWQLMTGGDASAHFNAT
jgi:hypothetical protein